MKRNLIFAIISVVIGILAGASVYFYEYFYPKQYVKNEAGEYVNVAAAKNSDTFPVTKSTVFEIEYYYPDEQRTLKEQINDIPALLGCDKAGVLRYLDDYMQHLSHDEQDKGLASFELISYNIHRFRLMFCLRIYRKRLYRDIIWKQKRRCTVFLRIIPADPGRA